jgi:hypothetical protein
LIDSSIWLHRILHSNFYRYFPFTSQGIESFKGLVLEEFQLYKMNQKDFKDFFIFRIILVKTKNIIRQQIQYRRTKTLHEDASRQKNYWQDVVNWMIRWRMRFDRFFRQKIISLQIKWIQNCFWWQLQFHSVI